MLDIKKIYNNILDEDAMMAAGSGGAVGGEIAAPSNGGDADLIKSGMSTDNVLGKKCDHHKDGYLGPGCFHVPSRVCKMKREILSGKKKKGLKNIYAKGMKILSEVELNKDTILAIHSIPEEDIVDFVKKYDSSALYIDAIAYYPVTKLFFIKYNVGGSAKYILVDFDGKMFIDNNSSEKKIFTGKEVKAQYKMSGTKSNVWVVYGYEE